MQKTASLLTLAAVALVLAGCSASGVNPASPTRVCNLSANVLQLNVGTANIYGTSVGTNVATTYRQGNSGNCFAGNSGALVSTPTLTVPAAIAAPAGAPGSANSPPFDIYTTIETGPAPSEVGTTAITGSSQALNAATVTTFGLTGGAFGLGLEPFNYVSVGGAPQTVFPYPVPLYDANAATDLNRFTPGGGPPAFCQSGFGGCNAAGATYKLPDTQPDPFYGYPEGIDVFALAPAVGTYGLSVLVQPNTGPVTKTATAPITSIAPGVGLLPAIAPAVPTVYDPVTGSLTLTYTLPAGPPAVTEAYIQVTDIGPTMGGVSCLSTARDPNGATPANPVYYTIEVTGPGAGSGTITGTAAAPAICSAAQNTAASGGTATDGDEFTVQTIGFDYDLYGASYPNSLGKTAPSLAGTSSTGQADITISPQTEYTLPGGAVITNIQQGPGYTSPTINSLRRRS